MLTSPTNGAHEASPPPAVAELRPPPDPIDVFRRLRVRPRCLFLDSIVSAGGRGRYSFVTADPFDWVESPADQPDGFAMLRSSSECLSAVPVPDLPPFQGGVAGLFSYDLGRSFERLPAPRYDEFGVPAVAAGLYDVVIAFDHEQNRCWIVSQGLPETDPQSRQRRARQRLAQFQQWLTTPSGNLPDGGEPRADRLPVGRLAPSYPVPGVPDLRSNFTRSGYLQAVQQVIDYIRAGDVFQVNLSQRLLYPAGVHAAVLYERLRRHNPAPFAAYLDAGTFQVCSTSPERCLRVHDRCVEACPIKGTRPRLSRPEADLFAADDLRQSDKDRAENVMIVDLVRNDLSRVCDADSVRVVRLCSLETYAYVQHLVSEVRGRLADGTTPYDLLERTFPGGSVTGAPKIRAMEIIAELEPTARGAYCGCLGYVGFDGSMDTSILIRTVTSRRGWWQIPVGGGIVAPSSPAREYDETWHKAEGMLRALAVR